MWLFQSKQQNDTLPASQVYDNSITSYQIQNEPVISYKSRFSTKWDLLDAEIKKTSKKVSVLKPYIYESEENLTIEIIKKMKTLRHPNILSWLAGTEINSQVKRVSDIFVIVEHSTPLSSYLVKNSDSANFNLIVSWGLFQVTRALAFLNENCSLNHNAINVSSIFINDSGEWKIGVLDFVSPSNEDSPVDKSSVYYPKDGKNVDSWGLACLMWECFNPRKLMSRNNLIDDIGRIPKNLLKSYQMLLKPNRITVPKFLQLARQKSGGFYCNEYIDVLIFLEEIQIKDKEEKIEFMNNLGDKLHLYPDEIAKNKILPHLVQNLQLGCAGIEALVPVLSISNLLEQKDFESTVLPCLLKLFDAPDRMTRVKLLEQLPKFVQNISEKIVSNQIYPSIAIGFQDSNPVVREATMKAMIPISSKLSKKLLNESVSKNLVNLQSKDPQGGIRANATVCLAKLFPNFNQQIQSGPILSSFLRSTRDPFKPGKISALTAIKLTKDCYSAKDLASKILPSVCFSLVDQEKDVRKATLELAKEIIKKISKMEDDGTLEIEIPPVNQNPNLPNDRNADMSSTRQTEDSNSAYGSELFGQFASIALSMSSKIVNTAATSLIQASMNSNIENLVQSTSNLNSSLAPTNNSFAPPESTTFKDSEFKPAKIGFKAKGVQEKSMTSNRFKSSGNVRAKSISKEGTPISTMSSSSKSIEDNLWDEFENKEALSTTTNSPRSNQRNAKVTKKGSESSGWDNFDDDHDLGDTNKDNDGWDDFPQEKPSPVSYGNKKASPIDKIKNNKPARISKDIEKPADNSSGDGWEDW